MSEIEIHSAITVLNGIGIGKGATIGTDIKHKIRIREGEGIQIKTNPTNDQKLALTCIDDFSEKYNISVDNIIIETDLSFMSERGLKTSSISSLGIMILLKRYFDVDSSEREIIEMSCKSSIKAGVSITGALDDAYGCYKGGFVVTDNNNMRILKEHQLNLDKEIFYLVPNDVNVKSNFEFKPNLMEKYILNNVLKACLEGEWKKSIEFNTNLYSDYLLKDTDVIKNLREETKGVVGINGLGPSLFLVSDEYDASKNFEIIKDQFKEYDVIRGNSR